MPRSTKVPGSVTAAAIILFIYGGLSLGCSVCSGPDIFAADAALEEALDKEAPSHRVMTILAICHQLLFAFAFLACGLGVLKLLPMARLAACAIGAVDLILSIAGTTYEAMYTLPIHERFLVRDVQQGALPAGIEGFIKGTMTFAIILGIVVPMIFYATYLVLLSTRSARDAFAGRLPEPEADEPPRSRGYEDDDDYNLPPREPRNPGDTGITDRPAYFSRDAQRSALPAPALRCASRLIEERSPSF